MAFCGKCGAQLAPDASFCGKCGASQAPASPHSPVNEKELLRLNMVGNNSALTQVTGTLIISNKKIEFHPLGMYIFSKPILIPMSDITGVGPTKIMGLEIGLRVNTVSNQSYVFNVGLQNISKITQIVNTIKVAKS